VLPFSLFDFYDGVRRFQEIINEPVGSKYSAALDLSVFAVDPLNMKRNLRTRMSLVCRD